MVVVVVVVVVVVGLADDHPIFPFTDGEIEWRDVALETMTDKATSVFNLLLELLKLVDAYGE